MVFPVLVRRSRGSRARSLTDGFRLRTLALTWLCAAALACREAASPPADVAGDGALMAAPADSTLKGDPLSLSVIRGLAILNAPGDSLPNHVGNALNCTSCHLYDGRRAGAMPWVGVYARFPQYRSRSGRVDMIEDRVNNCIERSLNGHALDRDSQEMRDIVAYFAWLSRDIPVGTRVAGQGLDSIAPVPFDSAAGPALYAANCARCHGADGQGASGFPPAGLQGATAAPPLWGPRSFNIGAGMARLRAAAAFIGRQMPLDAPGTLSPADTYAIAAFMLGHERPDFARKADDWPKGGAPPDVAYRTR